MLGSLFAGDFLHLVMLGFPFVSRPLLCCLSGVGLLIDWAAAEFIKISCLSEFLQILLRGFGVVVVLVCLVCDLSFWLSRWLFSASWWVLGSLVLPCVIGFLVRWDSPRGVPLCAGFEAMQQIRICFVLLGSYYHFHCHALWSAAMPSVFSAATIGLGSKGLMLDLLCCFGGVAVLLWRDRELSSVQLDFGYDSKGSLLSILRSHLRLIPKPICSPARPSEPNNRHHNHQPQYRRHHHHHVRKLSGSGGPGAQASPVLWSKTKPMGTEISEPTSPKVTCAGQIKVRPKPSSCKNWQSVMEEIERLHINNRNHKKLRSTSWVKALGFKKDAMQFLAYLRRIRFDFRCFGSFPTSDLTSDDDDQDEEDDDNDEDEDYPKKQTDGASRTVFSKWFMVLQDQEKLCSKEDLDQPVVAACDPPPNALLLMRCRSAPPKTWLKEIEGENDEDEGEVREEEEEEEEKKAKLAMAEQKMNRSNSLAIVMKCDTDFYKFSTDIVKETWVVGGIRDPLMSRSRSWK
ncbi:hypothetical protein U1Q18_037667 [Sarracenia purpurea var. burkii]